MQKAYLLIIDSSKQIHKQLPALSTFENLYNLREKNGMKTFVAYAFRGNYKPQRVTQVRPKKSEVIDLSDVEIMTLPGFKTFNETVPPQEVEVKKVRKQKKETPSTDQ